MADYQQLARNIRSWADGASRPILMMIPPLILSYEIDGPEIAARLSAFTILLVSGLQYMPLVARAVRQRNRFNRADEELQASTDPLHRAARPEVFQSSTATVTPPLSEGRTDEISPHFNLS